MFAYPAQAVVDQQISKARIYAHAKPSKRLRELFVTQVEDIVWKYKLSPETTNLSALRGIQEIQVIELTLKAAELDLAVLNAIDRTIPFPLLFQLVHEERVRYCASYKRPSESDATKWVIEAVFESQWGARDIEHPPLPVALDLASLYEQMLRKHIALPGRAGESLVEHIARFNKIESARKLQSQLQARLAKEVQFNRKLEIHARLRELAAQLSALQS